MRCKMAGGWWGRGPGPKTGEHFYADGNAQFAQCVNGWPAVPGAGSLCLVAGRDLRFRVANDGQGY